jgi:[protein-PII] uridylyltransferase
MGRFMPEFGRVVALMQFNMYHHYTVDEHLLVAVGNISRMERGEFRRELPLVSDLIKRVKSREVLYVATLLHDMAKGLPGDHSDIGAAMADAVCPRFGLSAEDTDTVAWLVRNHLVMSDAAQKRDVSDPKTVQDFVGIVQTPERLRLLLILTAADIRAVGPGVWNGWKAQLLRELYFEAETLMSGGDSAPARSTRIDEAKGGLETRLSDFGVAARERALSHHYDSYWLAFDTDELEFHARLIRSAEEKDEKVTVGAREISSAVTEIVIYTADHPGLFSRLAGAISISNGSIVGAKIFTTSDGYALDVFRVQDAAGGPFGDGGRLERLRQTVVKTLTGEIRPRDILAKRAPGRRAAAFKTQPKVNFDNQGSTISTMVEVESLDRVGLLYEITRGLFEAGMTISSAIVATYGELAVDTFYIRDIFGHKVTHPERLAAIKARLMKALEG